MNLYLTKSGRLRRKDNTLSFELVSFPEATEECLDAIDCGGAQDEQLEELPASTKYALPIESINAVYIFGEVSFNARLMNFLAQRHVPVHLFNYFGHHTGTFLPHAEQLSGNLVIKQSLIFESLDKRLYICRQLLSSVIHNIHSVVAYYERRIKSPALTELSNEIPKYEKCLYDARSPEELMGIEGRVRRLYYQCWHFWLGEIAKNFRRIYHPPDTPLNSLVSFLNSLLYTTCVSELYRTALYPGISYLHSPQARRYSLALDLSEPFKPVMVDRMVFRLLNSRAISDSDFLPHTNGFILSDDARKRILAEWDALIRETVFYKNLDRSVSYRQLIRLDCYKLIKHLLEEEEFKPFRMEY